MGLLTSIKNWLVRRATTNEYCEECCKQQRIVWWVSDTLWAEVTGCELKPENMPGVLCPDCFNKKALALGINLRWVPTENFRVTVKKKVVHSDPVVRVHGKPSIPMKR